jgi:hypothetical protein
MARRGRTRKKLLDDVKEKRGYWKLKEKALDPTMCRIRFRRGYRPAVRVRSACARVYPGIPGLRR